MLNSLIANRLQNKDSIRKMDVLHRFFYNECQFPTENDNGRITCKVASILLLKGFKCISIRNYWNQERNIEIQLDKEGWMTIINYTKKIMFNCRTRTFRALPV
jgi:hypothetical protein